MKEYASNYLHVLKKYWDILLGNAIFASVSVVAHQPFLATWAIVIGMLFLHLRYFRKTKDVKEVLIMTFVSAIVVPFIIYSFTFFVDILIRFLFYNASIYFIFDLVFIFPIALICTFVDLPIFISIQLGITVLFIAILGKKKAKLVKSKEVSHIVEEKSNIEETKSEEVSEIQEENQEIFDKKDDKEAEVDVSKGETVSLKTSLVKEQEVRVDKENETTNDER